MTKKTKSASSILAASVATLFCAIPFASAAPAADKAAGGEVMCEGINSCKGKGACAGVNNACAGKNGCKGHGMMKTTTKEECLKKGGKVVEKK